MTATLNEDATLLDGTGPFADLPEREPRFIWIPPKRGYLTRTVDEAIACSAKLRCPSEIAVRPSGRYTEIVGAKFS